MSDPTAPRCAWHPDRQTWVSCSRCGRPICPDCMNTAPVGFHCPACIREGQPARRIRQVNNSPVTRLIIGICVAVFGFESLTGTDLAYQFGLAGVAVTQYGEYYRLLTAMFLHGGFMHILFNMMILWQLGTALESFLGSSRFLGLYLASGLAGGVASVLLNDPMTLSVGASGAIFGLMGAYAVLARRLNLNSSQVTGLIAINLVIGFLVPGIDWHAHVGGLLMGLALGQVISVGRR